MQHPIVKTIKSRMAAIKSIENLIYLDLSQIQCRQLPIEAKVLLEKCTNLQQLILNNCGLETLNNLPNIPISILQLSSNHLTQFQLQKLAIYSLSLQQVNLQFNKIQDISNLSVFQSFSLIEQINLKGNPLCNIFPNYNEKIFNEILPLHPTLKIIDCFRKNGEIISDQEGNDQELDGPLWMLSQNIEEEKSNNEESSSMSQNLSQPGSQPNDNKKMNMLKEYEKSITNQPGFLINYLNKNERFVDPIQNCLDEECDFEDEEDEEQFRDQIQKGGFKHKQSKKRKFQFTMHSEDSY